MKVGTVTARRSSLHGYRPSDRGFPLSDCSCHNKPCEWNHLSSLTPEDCVKGMYKGSCIPNHLEQTAQRKNYVSLVARTIAHNYSFSKICLSNIFPTNSMPKSDLQLKL